MYASIMCSNMQCIIFQDCWLAASPDGLVLDPSNDDELGLVEIKCPFRAKDATLINLCTGKCNGFFLKHSDGQLSLKRNHDYYYQVQGQMHILKRNWCDFVVWIPRNDDYVQERIYYDNDFWKDKMIPKLIYLHYYQKQLHLATHLNQSVTTLKLYCSKHHCILYYQQKCIVLLARFTAEKIQ